MKKALLIICLAAASLTSFAQSQYDKIHFYFGVKGGANFGELHAFKERNIHTHSEAVVVPNAGIFTDIRFKSISVQPAILMSGKGARYKFKNAAAYGLPDHTQIRLYYLQIPVNFLYHISITSGELFFGGGPYYATKLGSTSSLIGFETISSVIQTAKDAALLKTTTETGLGATVGYVYKQHFLLNLNYDFGLSDMGINNEKGKLLTRTFGFSIGYQI